METLRLLEYCLVDGIRSDWWRSCLLLWLSLYSAGYCGLALCSTGS